MSPHIIIDTQNFPESHHAMSLYIYSFLNLTQCLGEFMCESHFTIAARAIDTQNPPFFQA